MSLVGYASDSHLAERRHEEVVPFAMEPGGGGEDIRFTPTPSRALLPVGDVLADRLFAEMFGGYARGVDTCWL